jgi:hypothetical protein
MEEEEGGLYAGVKWQGREVLHPCHPLLSLRMGGAIPHMPSFLVQRKLRSLLGCDPDCSVVPRMRAACSRLWHIAWGGMRFTSFCNYLHILVALMLFHLFNFFPPCRNSSQCARASSLSRFLHSCTQHTTLATTPLGGWSTRRNTQHSQDTDINAPGGIRTRNPRKRTATDPRLRPRGRWDRP